MCVCVCVVLLNSFRPQGGVIRSVAIYPSDFGRERMAAEDVQGPAELIEESEGEDEETVEVMGTFPSLWSQLLAPP